MYNYIWKVLLKQELCQVQAHLSKWVFTEMPVIYFGESGQTAYNINLALKALMKSGKAVLSGGGASL